MPINNDQWQDIEEHLRSGFTPVRFKLDGHNISVKRGFVSESRTALVVFINGLVELKHSGISGDSPDIVKKVWRKRSQAKHKEAFKQKIIKIYGKRGAKKAWPGLDDRIEYFYPTYTTAKSLVRQFKKLQGIELISERFKSAEDETE